MSKILNLIKKVKPVHGWLYRVCPPKSFERLDKEILALGNKESLDNDDYQSIFTYLIEGINAYRTPGSSQILYPGVPGTRGLQVEGLEGFARTSTMLATWLYGGRTNNILLNDNNTFDIIEHLKQGMLNGTTPEHSEYWGDITNFDQRSVEAGDIALTLWLLSSRNEDIFSKVELEQILYWLRGINNVKLYGGNWCLFKLIVNVVLNLFGEHTNKSIDQSYDEFKSFAVGDGWFGDGKNGFVDYYNVWQMQYYLYWLNQLKPEYDFEYLRGVFANFSAGYKYMISPNGTPMFGRSSCYRLAIATPLIINSTVNKVDFGISKRALEASWIHFIKHSALKGGTVTQGYYRNRAEILENYSGRASSLWSLRSLTIAFLQKPEGEFWTCKPGKLPIEEESYKIDINGPEFTITGDHKTQVIELYRNKTYFRDKNSHKDIKKLSCLRVIIQALLRRPLREEHLNIKYGRKKYTSNNFFCS